MAKQAIKPFLLLFVSGMVLLMSFSVLQRDHSKPLALMPAHVQQVNASNITGAWRMVEQRGKADNKLPAADVMKIITNKHFTIAYYDHQNKKFTGTEGGTYTVNNNIYTGTLEFNTMDSTKVGTSTAYTINVKNNRLYISGTKDGVKTEQVWEKAEQRNTQSTPLAGTWRISGRLTPEGEMTTIQRGPRKTIKILSNNRFQWIAINTATTQFFGTGGGTYTAEGGKYTENIEFFSRDPQRVGAKLSFDFEVKGDNWHHSGLSTTGNKINEVWSRED
jgi:hypothetical protein